MTTKLPTQSGRGGLDLLALLSHIAPDVRRVVANPSGRNQFTECPPKKDPDFLKLLRELRTAEFGTVDASAKS